LRSSRTKISGDLAAALNTLGGRPSNGGWQPKSSRLSCRSGRDATGAEACPAG
jgi:hypothetical protein